MALDQDFALAHATLAFAYSRTLGIFLDQLGSVDELETLIRDHAQKALEIDPNQGLAYAALASIDEAYWRVPESQVNWEKALESSPNDVNVLDEATKFYSFTGQFDKAAALVSRAETVNPAAGRGVGFTLAARILMLRLPCGV